MANRTDTQSACPPLAALLVLLLGLVTFLVSGCNRAFYRSQADRDVYELVDCAASDPRWPLEDYTIRPDPKSRMYDPDPPDCPPMPPDDPTSHRLMHCVDCKQGWRHWHSHGDTPYVENPNWQAHLLRDESGAVVLDRQAAVRLALLHSREYQDELENLYLSALDVTFQRFRFDTQFYGGNSTFFTADGPDRSGTASSELSTDTDLEMRRMLASGGELVVGVANSLVWQFSGPDDYSGTTLLDFSLVQPLLRAAGRAVVLESLTDSQRELLADIRRLERFRREFYIQTVTGGRSGGGLLGLLQDQLEIRNQQANLADLQESLERILAFNEANRITSLQVDQTRQGFLSSQIQLVSRKTSYQDRLDAYKIILGLPPGLDLRVEDPLLDRFELVDPELTATREDAAELLKVVLDPQQALQDDTLRGAGMLRQDCEARIAEVREDVELLKLAAPQRREQLQTVSARAQIAQEGSGAGIWNVEELDRRIAKLQSDLTVLVEPRLELRTTVEKLKEFRKDPPGVTTRVNAEAKLEAQKKAEAAGIPFVEPQPKTPQQYRAELLAQLRAPPAMQTLLERVEQFRQGPAAAVAAANADNRVRAEARGEDAPADITPGECLRELVSNLSDRLLELSLIQARARLDTATLVPVELDAVEALEIARTYRRDWMNARADLVDSWRQIEVTANDLRSDLDVTFSGDIGTTDENPFRFRGTTGRLRVGLEFDAPLTRLAERNEYRRALIAYQQARRTYYAFEDGIDQNLRSTLRAIRLNELNLELRRVAAFAAIRQVEQTQLRLKRPPKPGETTSQLGATTARDLVDALNRLLSEQNAFLGVWVDNEVQRLNLELNLGTMELDDEGMWIDRPIPSARVQNAAQPEEIQLPPGMGILNEIEPP